MIKKYNGFEKLVISKIDNLKEDIQENKSHLLRIDEKLESGTGKIATNRESAKSAHKRLNRLTKGFYIFVGSVVTLFVALLNIVIK